MGVAGCESYPSGQVTRLDRLRQTAVLGAQAEPPDTRAWPHESDPGVGVFRYIFAGGLRWAKRWPLFILMRHSNQLSCKYVSTLINLRMNGDLYHPVLGLFTPVQRICSPCWEFKSDGKRCCFFFSLLFDFSFIALRQFLCRFSSRSRYMCCKRNTLRETRQ